MVLVAQAVLDGANRYDAQLRLGVLLTIWPLMLFTCLQCFRQLPPPVLPKDPLFVRAGSRLRLWFYHGMALAVGVMGLILLSISLKLLGP